MNTLQLSKPVTATTFSSVECKYIALTSSKPQLYGYIKSGYLR